jgi:hypothetical protein
VDIVKECCTSMLHNYVRQRYRYSFENTLLISDLENIRHEKSVRGVSANETKNVFADYFLTRVGSRGLFQKNYIVTLICTL